ncbi:MAG: outer membrane protein assembly factor BamB family protein [Planctomycetota bacterium]|jgi:outer membrane protein assembly factor BamB
MRTGWTVKLLVILAMACWAASGNPARAGEAKSSLPERVGIARGIVVVLGLPENGGAAAVVDLVKGTELLVYFQSPQEKDVAAVREAAEAAGLLGKRVFAARGPWGSVGVAANLADAVLVSADAAVPQDEVLRVLHPGAKAIIGGKQIVKPATEGVDSWSHHFHGPDNNPQSTDQLARAPYITQFLAGPMFCSQPEITVAAGGRLFKAFGHIAHRTTQNAVINTLYAVNGYNGTVLWTRKLRPGFMIQRSTMIATPKTLYLADDQSCKLLDAATGELKKEIVPPKDVAGGTVWKWMAMEGSTLYALLGGEEIKVPVKRGRGGGVTGWPWAMWPGYDYKDREKAFGFGRALLAIDPKTGKVLWSHREKELLDSRGLCMKNGRIYFYSPGKFLGCLNARTGKELWRTSDAKLLAAIGEEGRAQHYTTGFSPAAYLKCNDKYLCFAGPQRSNLVVVRTGDGSLAWQQIRGKSRGNYQLVLRADAIYAAGPRKRLSYKLAYDTGKVLGTFAGRSNCTRATGSIDSVFFRGYEGTLRLDTTSGTLEHIAPMRPPCHDGVIISDGLLYWGPWQCGCKLSLFGHICLGPAGKLNLRPGANASRLEAGPGKASQVDETGGGDLRLAESADGVIRATGPDGKLRWKAYTGGEVRFPPVNWKGRVYAGSNDGRVYCFEAATGKLLWRFRAAPYERKIPVYGKLSSTWPVAGGVVVADGVVYAAAGIANFDGTHVYALDARTGKIKWYNDTSGRVAPKLGNGISLCGRLQIADGKLCFPGGSVYRTAQYDLNTGKCLNTPRRGDSTDRSLFYVRGNIKSAD